MSAVVVGAPLRGAGHQRQDRSGAVQGLDAGLLVHAEHHRGLRRVRVQAHHVSHLVDELRVRRQLELPGEVRLEPERPPHPRDRRLRHAHRFGHRARRPVRRAGGGGLQGAHDHLLDHLVGDGARWARARVVRQPVEAAQREAAPPLRQRRLAAPSLAAIDLFVSPPAAPSTIRHRSARA